MQERARPFTGVTMKTLTACILAIVLAFSAAKNVNAQGAESIWLTANTTAYKTGETVSVLLNASSATPIQGLPANR